MSSVSSIRLPGLATGMDTEAMVKAMTTAEQNKIDKAQQKEQTIKWQQEIYREIISEAKSLNDKYFSITSKDSIISSSAWNTLSINSSDTSMMTVKGNSGATEVNYEFKIDKLAQPATLEAKFSSKTASLGITKEIKFTIDIGDTKSKEIVLNTDDTVETMIKKINDAVGDKAKASYSEMTGKFTIKTTDTGKDSTLNISASDESSQEKLEQYAQKFIDSDNKLTISDILSAEGSNMVGKVYSNDEEVRDLNDQKSNSFTIDNIEYNIHLTGTSTITSKQDYQSVLDKMNSFIEDYNKLMDKVYGLLTEKVNNDYLPLTEAQREEMSEDEIEKWEEKAKVGVLRNDSEMRRFMDNMQTAIFGNNMKYLNSIGLSSHENYNNKGQIALDEEKFIKALQSDSQKVYESFAGNKNSVFENMKATMNNYVGGSSSIFAKKAGLEKTASFTNNYYSEQLKKQADLIKTLQNKMYDKEDALYKKFGALESSMSKLNNQMSYFSQV